MTPSEAHKVLAPFIETLSKLSAAVAVVRNQAYCLECGDALEAPTRMTSGGLVVEPTGAAFFDGNRLPITRVQYRLLAALMRNAGRPVSVGTLARAMNYDGELPRQNINTALSNVRRALRDAGTKLPVGLVSGQGWVWTEPVVRSEVEW